MRFAEEVALEKGRQCRGPVRKTNDGSNQRRDQYGGENGTTGDQLQGGLTERRIERVAAPACGFGVYAGCGEHEVSCGSAVGRCSHCYFALRVLLPRNLRRLFVNL